MWRNRVAAIERKRSKIAVVDTLFFVQPSMPNDRYSIFIWMKNSWKRLLFHGCAAATADSYKYMQNGHFNLKICYKMWMRRIKVNFWNRNSRTENNYLKWCSILVSGCKNEKGKMLSHLSVRMNFSCDNVACGRTHTRMHNVASRRICFSLSLFWLLYLNEYSLRPYGNWWKIDANKWIP